MNLKEVIPKPERILLEVLIVAGGVLGAAFLISRFPKLQQFVQQNSVVVKDGKGDVIF